MINQLSDIFSDVLAADSVRSQLSRPMRVEVFDSIDSTNNYVKSLAGEREPLLVAANMQTSGRGRLGRSFFSPEKSGLYMSLLVFPSLTASVATGITAAAAVAVAESLNERFGNDYGIKWVNDIYKDGKKVCGILTESAISPENGCLDYAVIGIGINLYPPENGFPEQLQDIAGYICDAPRQGLKSTLVADITNRFYDYYEKLPQSLYADKYKQLSIVLNHRVYIPKYDKSAFVVDIDSLCRLVVSYNDGRLETLDSGEISIKL